MMSISIIVFSVEKLSPYFPKVRIFYFCYIVQAGKMNICVGGELDGQVIEKKADYLRLLTLIHHSKLSTTSKFLTVTTLIIILATNRVQLA